MLRDKQALGWVAPCRVAGGTEESQHAQNVSPDGTSWTQKCPPSRSFLWFEGLCLAKMLYWESWTP